MPRKNRYERLIEAIFFSHFSPGITQFDFKREEIERYAKKLRIKLPKNVGDLIYSFRYRASLPDKVLACAPEGKEWMILPAGRSRHRFTITDVVPQILPNEMLAEIKVPDATPGVISMYALSDEQALLAKLRYNRLIDIFSRVACYSLQRHLRTTVPGLGQVETDEVYVGVDRGGAHYVFPVQAKGKKDKLNIVQIRQDIGVCKHKFPLLICRPLGAQFMQENLIALFEFEQGADQVKILSEKHYRLVPPDELTPEDLEKYKRTTVDEK
jgi:hypothetical protein